MRLSVNTVVMVRRKKIMMIRTHRELSRLETFEERFEYLKLKGSVGRDTFGFDRYLNQKFYTSTEWRNIRHHVIARDLGCDLGVEGYEIYDKIIIHHMNPMSPDDIIHGNNAIVDPEFLISTTLQTHNAIHYGNPGQIPNKMTDRQPGDTKLW